jgi:hypothetical protein
MSCIRNPLARALLSRKYSKRSRGLQFSLTDFLRCLNPPNDSKSLDSSRL